MMEYAGNSQMGVGSGGGVKIAEIQIFMRRYEFFILQIVAGR